MARRVDDLEPPKVNRIPIVRNLGTCSCGCGELIHSNYEYLIYEGDLFLDRSCLFVYLIHSGVLEEVG